VIAADLARKHKLLAEDALQAAKAKFTKTQEKIRKIVSAEDKARHVMPHAAGEHTWPPLLRGTSQGTLGLNWLDIHHESPS
jgi:hypothetical protein